MLVRTTGGDSSDHGHIRDEARDPALLSGSDAFLWPSVYTLIPAALSHITAWLITLATSLQS